MRGRLFILTSEGRFDDAIALKQRDVPPNRRKVVVKCLEVALLTIITKNALKDSSRRWKY